MAHLPRVRPPVGTLEESRHASAKSLSHFSQLMRIRRGYSTDNHHKRSENTQRTAQRWWR